MDIFDVVGYFTDFITSWKWWLCLTVSIGISAFLYYTFPDQMWVWFVSAPLVIVSIVVAWKWDSE